MSLVVWSAKVLWAKGPLVLPSIVVGAGASVLGDYIAGIAMFESREAVDF